MINNIVFFRATVLPIFIWYLFFYYTDDVIVILILFTVCSMCASRSDRILRKMEENPMSLKFIYMGMIYILFIKE